MRDDKVQYNTVQYNTTQNHDRPNKASPDQTRAHTNTRHMYDMMLLKLRSRLFTLGYHHHMANKHHWSVRAGALVGHWGVWAHPFACLPSCLMSGWVSLHDSLAGYMVPDEKQMIVYGMTPFCIRSYQDFTEKSFSKTAEWRRSFAANNTRHKCDLQTE